MATPARATPTVSSPPASDRPSPAARPPTTASRAAPGGTSPRGSGLPGFCPRSCSMSARSFKAPIEACRQNMAAPRRSARSSPAPARRTSPPVSRASSSDGKGWISRITPAAREPAWATWPGRSDVDEVLEVLDEVLDDPVATVGGLPADPRDERPEHDRRDDRLAARVAAEGRRRPATGGIDPLEGAVVDVGRLLEVGQHPEHAAAPGNVAHQLRRPGVKLAIVLLLEPLPILGRIGRQSRRTHRNLLVNRVLRSIAGSARPRAGPAAAPGR